jgi:anti-anti-sigma factor
VNESVGFEIEKIREPKGSGMEIDRADDNGVTVVTVRGVINFGESARQFSSFLQELLNSGSPAVLVDMSGIDNVDSTGLGELVGYLQRFEKEGRRLALLRPHRRIMSLLRLTRLDEIFPVYDDRDAAIAELSG